MLEETYPAKILLFGEYSILNGSQALAIPYESFSGKWTYQNYDSEESRISKDSLKNFLSHHGNDCLDHERLASDVEKGLWFDSTIPHGFGLGSSGAIIAAIYKSYSKCHSSLIEDKKALAKLEDHFHGSSSGIDPLVSLLKTPLLIHNFENVEVIKRSVNLSGFFLVNTGHPRKTGPLVTIYQQKIKDPEFKRGCAEVLSTEVNFAIKEFLQEDRSYLFHHLWLISKFQWDYFSEMIPDQVREAWLRGLESREYVLKLCGAGGGGFVLGYRDPAKSSPANYFLEKIISLT